METKDKKILVTGCTGQQGGAVARHLLDKGFQVCALTRDPSKPSARQLQMEGAQVIKGNLDDPGSYEGILDQCYGVFSVQGMEGGTDVEIRQGISLADAARDAGVKHFVYSSVGAADRNTGIPHFESKWEIEDRIRDIDLPYTILRPVFFMENWQNYLRDQILGGVLPQPLSPETRLQMIAVDDIGAFAAMAFEEPDQWLGEEIELAGDEKSMKEVADLFSRIIGRQVKYVQVPWDEFRNRMGEDLTKMYQWFEEEGYSCDIEALRNIYPQLATLEQVLRSENWRMRMTA